MQNADGRPLPAHPAAAGALNQVGGGDELIFDGCSKVFDAAGTATHRLAAFDEQVTRLEFNELAVVPMADPAAELPQLAQVYRALVLAVRDYVTKNGFKGAVLACPAALTRR